MLKKTTMKNLKTARLPRCLLPALMLLCAGPVARGQDDASLDLIRRYAEDKLLVTEAVEELEITVKDGEPRARSTTRIESLLTDPIAASAMATDNIYHGYMVALTSMRAVSMIPKPGGYRKEVTRDTVTTSSPDDDIFLNDNVQTRVTYPGITAGARTQLEYTLDFRDAHFLRPWYFESGGAALSSTLRVTVPEDMELGWHLSGARAAQVVARQEQGRRTKTYIWTLDGIKRTTGYGDAPSAAWYLTSIVVYIKSYRPSPGEPKAAYLGSVDDLYRYNYSFLKRMSRDAPSDSLKALARRLAPTPGEEAGAQAIYRWVQDQVRYVAFEDGMGGYVPRPANDVLARRYGDCKDMTSLLVALYRAAGYDAAFAWTGSRSIAHKLNEVPTPNAFNHMVCAVKLKGQWAIADGTSSCLPLGTPPEMLQEKELLIAIDSQAHAVQAMPTPPPEHNLVTDTTLLTLDSGAVAGQASIHYEGYPAYDLQIALNRIVADSKEEEKLTRELATRGSNKYEQQRYAIANRSSATALPWIHSSFRLADYLRAAGNDQFINLNLTRPYNGEISSPGRTSPVSYRYATLRRDVTILSVPKGYRVSYLPPAASGGKDGLWSYNFQYRQEGDQVMLIREFRRTAIMIPASLFAAQDAMVRELQGHYAETVVLTKNEPSFPTGAAR